MMMGGFSDSGMTATRDVPTGVSGTFMPTAAPSAMPAASEQRLTAKSDNETANNGEPTW
jgi:hypothetical protein